MARFSPQAITRLLREWADGSQSALEVLTPRLYGESRRLARSYLQGEERGYTLRPTALVHEGFLHLIERTAPDYQNRSQFYGLAAHP